MRRHKRVACPRSRRSAHISDTGSSKSCAVQIICDPSHAATPAVDDEDVQGAGRGRIVLSAHTLE